MPLHKLKESELRDHCKRHVEAIEYWLRRLIHDKLSETYGENYIEAKRSNGGNVVNKSIQQNLKKKLEKEPTRYSRTIDAATLEIEIDLICNPELHREFFKDALKHAFPEGCEEASTFLKRLIEPRNMLYHANPISVRQAEQIICYTNDVIDALKAHYRVSNLAGKYNSPTIIRLTDSFGANIHADQITRNSTGNGHVDRRGDEKIELRPGDVLSIEVEIDPTFEIDSYNAHWVYENMGTHVQTGNKFVLQLENQHVKQDFIITCLVKSNKSWHQLGEYDDRVSITYEVLPPLE